MNIGQHLVNVRKVSAHWPFCLELPIFELQKLKKNVKKHEHFGVQLYFQLLNLL